MSSTWQAIFFSLAVVCFLLHALRIVVFRRADGTPALDLLSLGLAFFSFVFAYNAWYTAT
jgi:hypothetical protein